MNIILDTNILIYREDYSVISSNIGELLKILLSLQSRILVYPSSLTDIQNDSDEERRTIMLSKIAAYPVLENPPIAQDDKDFISKIGYPKNQNDSIDNEILYSIFRNAADFLITEDKGLYKKALKVRLEDRVFVVDEAISYLRKYFLDENIFQPFSIKVIALYNINLNDPFFDSLKLEYPDFCVWWLKKCRQGVKARVYIKDDGALGAILIWKIEMDGIEAKPYLPAKNRLKIATFKVSYPGFKIGELFLKMSIQYAIKNNIDEIYLTHYTKQDDDLARLIHEYGFSVVAKMNDEDVYLKKLILYDSEWLIKEPTQIAKTFYPSFYDGSNVRKFIVPIVPKYHNRLFVELSKEISLFEWEGDFIVEGNTIRKAYLCHAPIRRITSGDILLFYQSRHGKCLTAIGTVENVYYDIGDVSDIIRIVGKRSVYSIREIESMVSKPTMVIIFRLHFYMNPCFKYQFLHQNKVLNGPPQSILELSHDKYLLIKKGWGINERFTVH